MERKMNLCIRSESTILTMTQPQFRRRDSKEGREALELLEKMAEAGRNMTPADYRAQRKSYALGAAKTDKEREMLSERWDRLHGD